MFGIELERMNLNGVLIEQTSSHLRDFAFEEFGQPCLLEDAALKNMGRSLVNVSRNRVAVSD
jgi:hypothetical protein